jgi:methanogenic corrinoid protein MtbC1
MTPPKEIFEFISQNTSKISETWYKLISNNIPPENMFSKIALQRAMFYFDMHLHYIVGAVVLSDPTFYTNYTLWTKRMIESRNQQLSFLKINFECIKVALKMCIPQDYFIEIEPILNAGEKILDLATPSIPDFHYEIPYDKTLAQKYIELVVKGKKFEAMALVEEQLTQGVSISKIYQELLTPCQYEIGRLWETNRISVAQEHLATAITQYIMGNLFPRLHKQILPQTSKPKILGVCIGPELHELGLRMLMDLFEFNGWDTTFLGANNPIDDLITLIKAEKFDVLAISIAMVSRIKEVQMTIEKIHNLDGPKPKILVGGYPFNQNKNLWKIVNADGYAENFDNALIQALNWVKKK